MIKYNVIEYNGSNKCIISEKESILHLRSILYYKNIEMNTSRFCVYYEDREVEELYKEDLFDSIDMNFNIENYINKPSKFITHQFDDNVSNTNRFIKKVIEFKEEEDILPYLISRFGLNNIFIESDDKIVKISYYYLKSYQRDRKIDKLLNKF